MTNQLQSNWELAKRVFEQMNVEYTAVMRRFSSQGWLAIWDTAKPSVWLTSLCVRVLAHVAFQDWEDYIYIEPEVITSSVMWLINYQDVEGEFIETDYYRDNPLHKPMAKDDKAGHIALTAHVLISLVESGDHMFGETKKFSSTARLRARRYLERNLPDITNPYDLAIVAYALVMSQSPEADAAYGRLLQMRREESGMVYWSPTPIKTNEVQYLQFNRPFLKGKFKQINDAVAVEATGYALLVLFKVEGGGVTVLQDQIVTWLNTMRLGVGGFIGTQDTIIALEALVSYSYNSRIKDITNMNIEVEIPDSNITSNKYFSPDGAANLQEILIPNVWGHVNFHATGAGLAVAQLDVNWGIDYEPLKDQPEQQCFNLTIDETFCSRNKSEIDVKSWVSWTCTDHTPTSGIAMLVMDIPSEYIMMQVKYLNFLQSFFFWNERIIFFSGDFSWEWGGTNFQNS